MHRQLTLILGPEEHRQAGYYDYEVPQKEKIDHDPSRERARFGSVVLRSLIPDAGQEMKDAVMAAALDANSGP